MGAAQRISAYPAGYAGVMGNIGDQVTLQKTLSGSSLDPGTYRIQIKVNDNISKQSVGPTATFAVE